MQVKELTVMAMKNGWTRGQLNEYVNDNYEEILIDTYPTTREFIRALRLSEQSSWGEEMDDGLLRGIVLSNIDSEVNSLIDDDWEPMLYDAEDGEYFDDVLPSLNRKRKRWGIR